MNTNASPQVPVIDISPLLHGNHGARLETAAQLGAACRDMGFFYIQNHGISLDLQQDLERLSRQFFALPLAEKMQIRMELGGRAWRGFFPVGDELTSGKPDLKEGLYFGTELAPDHPLVLAKTPMHGANLFPTSLPGLKSVVLSYMEAVTQLGHRLMEGLSLSLGLPEDYFFRHFTSDPLTLFRIFHYPPDSENPFPNAQWGVGEHTDYGVLTILKQDSLGGLQVKTRTGWIEAPYLDNTFVCNIGDMLDRMTSGLYRSTPHRVKNRSSQGRFSFPFFFDPNFEAEIHPVDLSFTFLPPDDKSERWDGQSVHEFQGTYGDYILQKVGRVFPQLAMGGEQ
ncbi:MAG: isopenicillin N synthase family oxygenase [Bacteroidia bacterium]|nr:isopenicillin N synthase family oxygenase [Bacteroidia bacterium]